MTVAQRTMVKRRLGFREGYSEGYAEGYAQGYAEGYADGYAEGYAEARNIVISVLKGLLEPAIIAEKLKVPLEQVLEIWEKE